MKKVQNKPFSVVWTKGQIQTTFKYLNQWALFHLFPKLWVGPNKGTTKTEVPLKKKNTKQNPTSI